MCCYGLEFRFGSTPERHWESDDDLPAEAEAWLDERSRSFGIGRSCPKDKSLAAYKEAEQLLSEFVTRFPELAERSAITRVYWCHGSELLQVYRDPAALQAAITNLEADRPLSEQQRYRAPSGTLKGFRLMKKRVS